MVQGQDGNLQFFKARPMAFASTSNTALDQPHSDVDDECLGENDTIICCNIPTTGTIQPLQSDRIPSIKDGLGISGNLTAIPLTSSGQADAGEEDTNQVQCQNVLQIEVDQTGVQCGIPPM